MVEQTLYFELVVVNFISNSQYERALRERRHAKIQPK